MDGVYPPFVWYGMLIRYALLDNFVNTFVTSKCC